VTEEQDRISRRSTARALVLLASGFAVAGAAIVCFVALVFGPALLERSGSTGTVVLAAAVFAVIVLVAAVVANLLAVRGRSLRGVVTLGCGTLLAGGVVGLGVLLLLISKTA
jgi:formate hydrogenlyase subunit 4